MKTTEISTNDLGLWKVAYSIRGLIEERSYYYGANPLPECGGATLISSVEQIFLTEGMMVSYVRESEPEGMFATDLRKWGVVQALVVQQDAVDFLARILQEPPLNPKNNADLNLIRDDLRNRYVGHPVKDNKATKFVITAASKDKEACFIELGAGGMKVRRFDLQSAIETQRAILADFLSNLRTKVMETEERFREEARVARPLDALRHSTFNYNLGKAHPDDDGLPLHNAKELQEQLGFFRQAFKDVGRLSQWVLGDLDTMDYAAAQIVEFHEAEDGARRLTADDAGIFLSFLGHQYERLITYADEIEDEIGDATQ